MGTYAGGTAFQRNYKQNESNKAMDTKLGTVDAKGVRKITDKNEIKQFVESLNK